MRREVDSLLNESSQTGMFMEEPAAGASAAAVMSLMSFEGRKLNHYEIGTLIGRGGMAKSTALATPSFAVTSRSRFFTTRDSWIATGWIPFTVKREFSPL
jgi:hypothetical protein